MRIMYWERNLFLIILIFFVCMLFPQLSYTESSVTGALNKTIDYFHSKQAEARKEACKATLKQIYGAKIVWAEDNKISKDVTPAWSDLVPKYIMKKPVCKLSDGSEAIYTIGKVSESPTCSIKEHNLTSSEFEEAQRMLQVPEYLK